MHALHHFHVTLDLTGRPTGLVLEHEHQVHAGVRHVHERERRATFQALLAQGMPEAAARREAIRLEGFPETTKDLARRPDPILLPDERTLRATLHPELRRELT